MDDRVSLLLWELGMTRSSGDDPQVHEKKACEASDSGKYIFVLRLMRRVTSVFVPSAVFHSSRRSFRVCTEISIVERRAAASGIPHIGSVFPFPSPIA